MASGTLSYSTPASNADLKDTIGLPPSAQSVRADDLFKPGLYDEHGINLQGIDDFELENPYTPPPKLVRLVPLEVDPIHAINFHDECQRRGVVADFDVTRASTTGFSGTVDFSGTRVQETGPFATKKEVKQALCMRALPILQSKGTSLKKRKSSELNERPRKVSPQDLNAENWIGTLNLYTQQQHLRKPDYDELQSARPPYEFACTLRIQSGPLTPFGSSDLYATKADARKAAAREAVMWLRSQGRELQTSPITAATGSGAFAKRRKPNEESIVQLEAGHTGLTQALSLADVNATSEISLPEQVHNLALSLGFTQPSFEVHPSGPPAGSALGRNENAGGFVTVAAHFLASDVQKEPSLTGPLGVVEHVYGRKKAKELCCRELLQILEGIKRDRIF